METNKTVQENKQPKQSGGLQFTRDNFMWMIIGAVVIAVGMMLMSGGASTNASVFDKTEVYSFRRITLAPIVILLGFGIEVFAILKKPKAKPE
ncbi:Protein of unknown function [Arachidicoccus rhizosphaerae]|jgi:hypothetical protein|uniref:DUF3098 domain-containing protein n=1 Tax=Arachidicoccus rhizosphaerae TaxID=551991 RepID=A0A1H3XF38_9BACT|nr:DUF3098 domain-containing protein [Arachidicoccus rhizosphaerae]SDZ97232.1 Protein of unknown function [Arachidicoccus rhizosphaerae]